MSSTTPMPSPALKKCGQCQQLKERSAFGLNRAKRDGLQVHCRDCKRKQQARWYAQNKERHARNVNARRRERTLEVQAHLWSYLQENPCVDCGECDPLMLDFDHVRGTKRESISQMVCSGLCWETIQAEIAKCEVRCVRCHRRRTTSQLGYSKMRFLERVTR